MEERKAGIILATKGTGDYLKKGGIEVDLINKVKEGSPHCVEMIESKKIDLVKVFLLIYS